MDLGASGPQTMSVQDEIQDNALNLENKGTYFVHNIGGRILKLKLGKKTWICGPEESDVWDAVQLHGPSLQAQTKSPPNLVLYTSCHKTPPHRLIINKYLLMITLKVYPKWKLTLSLLLNFLWQGRQTKGKLEQKIYPSQKHATFPQIQQEIFPSKNTNHIYFQSCLNNLSWSRLLCAMPLPLFFFLMCYLISLIIT